MTDTTSINIYKALHAALALAARTARSSSPKRDSFPTDLYIAEGVAAARAGATLRLAGDERRASNR